MKGLTILQPWANLIAFGLKTIETRGRRTNYRGPIAIHAGKSLEFCTEPYGKELRAGSEAKTLRQYSGNNHPPLEWPCAFPAGYILAVGELYDCQQSNWQLVNMLKAHQPYELEYGWLTDAHGYPDETRFAWMFRGIRLLARPVPCRGYQYLFDIPAGLLKGQI